MYYLNKKKGKKGFMAIKVDLTKAYDKVDWKVLCHVMKHFGFHEHFIKLVLACIEAPHFSILLNGAPFGYFTSTRGIRQGDPLSPGLFTIFSDILSRMLARAAATNLLSGVKTSRLGPKEPI